MNGVTIGVICSVLGALIGVWGFARYSKQDAKAETQSFTRVETKIDIMGGDIKDIRSDIKLQTAKNSDIEQRITRAEEIAKSAHKRIDELVKEE
jgi:sensor domain CHASE-containing protein